MWHTDEKINEEHAAIMRAVLAIKDQTQRYRKALDCIDFLSATSKLEPTKFRQFVGVLSQAATEPELFQS